MRSPPSTLSSRNAPPSGRSFANADTGVSRSARRSRTTGTSSRTAFFVVTTVVICLPPAKTKTLARSRDEGSWCHPILARHRWRTLSLRSHGAPFANGGLPGIPTAQQLRRATPVTRPNDRFQDAVSRDPFAPLPPPGLPPLPGSLSVFRGLIAPARATFAKTVAPGVGAPTGQGLGGRAPRRGRGPGVAPGGAGAPHPALGSSGRR